MFHTSNSLYALAFTGLMFIGVLGGCATVTTPGGPATPTVQTSPADASAGEVSIQLAGQNDQAIIVPVTINGQGPYSFVLDTGATLTCVDDDIVQNLKLPEKPGVIGHGSGIAGSPGQMKLLNIETLEVGTAEASNLMACMVDLDQMQKIGLEAEGLLGLNFLKSYTMTLDFQRNVLRLEK